MDQIFKSPDFVLHCSAACRELAPPAAVYLPVTSDLLRTSCLSESGRFSVSRIAAALLFDLLLGLSLIGI